MNRPPSNRPLHRQRGTVLVVAMILLLVLTLLGVTALNTTSVEERMAYNSQEMTRAFQAAETGLSYGFLDRVVIEGQGKYSEETAPLRMGVTNAAANYTNVFLGAVTVPPCPSDNVASCWSVDDNVANQFETVSTGISQVGATELRSVDGCSVYPETTPRRPEEQDEQCSAGTQAPSNAAQVELVGGFIQISKK